MAGRTSFKLGDQKFLPLLDSLYEGGVILSKKHSKIIQHCIWYMHILNSEKVKELGDKTRFEHLMESEGLSKNEGVIKLHKRFHDFLDTE